MPYLLKHGDVFTIGDRHFRWEFPRGKKITIWKFKFLFSSLCPLFVCSGQRPCGGEGGGAAGSHAQGTARGISPALTTACLYLNWSILNNEIYILSFQEPSSPEKGVTKRLAELEVELETPMRKRVRSCSCSCWVVLTAYTYIVRMLIISASIWKRSCNRILSCRGVWYILGDLQRFSIKTC